MMSQVTKKKKNHKSNSTELHVENIKYEFY